MTGDSLTVTEDAALDEVVKLMEKHQIKRVPVVRGGEVVGIVTRANLLHALAGVSRETSASVESTDTAIRAAFLAEVAKEKWAPIAPINPIVRNGVVELWGTVTDERARQALIVAAENVPGVRSVRIIWLGSSSRRGRSTRPRESKGEPELHAS